MTGQLTEEQIDILLNSSVVGHLGCFAEQYPYVVPITYAYRKPFIYSHTYEGLKTALMRKNPKVCFEIDQIDNLANWRSAIIYGTFEELKDEEAEEAMLILKSRLNPIQTSIYSLFLWDVQAKNLQPRHKTAEVIFRIRIMEKTGRFEKKE